jgi:hypothetical protein
MNQKIRFAGVVFAAALAFFSCQKKTQVKGVDLGVSFAEATLSDNLMTDVTYQWKTGADFKPFDRDYTIFVHYWHDSNLIVQDDYAPDVPTSKWEKNKEYTFKRRLYIPAFIDEFDPQFKGEETLRLSSGFYNPFDRTGKSQREVLSKKLKVLPPPLGTPEVIYESGWYDQEINRDSPLKQWRWTAKEAKCIVEIPSATHSWSSAEGPIWRRSRARRSFSRSTIWFSTSSCPSRASSKNPMPSKRSSSAIKTSSS